MAEGVALIGAGAVARHGIVRSRTLGLNEALHSGLDETYVEMNGFFGADGSAYPILADLLIEDLDRQANWDEFRISGLLPEAAAATRDVARRHGLRAHVFNRKPTYWVDLERVREQHGGDFLASRSGNSRQQIRRSIRGLEKDFGILFVERAGSAREADEWLLAAGPLHRARWAVMPDAVYGGFDNSHFVGFHRTLIAQSFEAGAIHVWRVRAGDRVLAYLYNFFANGVSSFYLSGIDYTVGEKYKPGIVAHVLVIQRYLEEGARRYDFMAGAARYKASLATHESTQEWLVLQRPRLMLRAEALARQIKARLRAGRRDGARESSGDNE